MDIEEKIQNLSKEIIEDYKKNISIRQISKKYNIWNRAKISEFLEKANIKTNKNNHYRIYFHQEDYFHTIDNEHKAYWLGWMFSDGYIVDNSQRYGEDCFGLSVAESDIQVLYNFKKDLQATNPINTYTRNSKTPGQPLSRVVCASQQTVNDLMDKGCVKQKTPLIKPPTNIPDSLLPDFIRGFFEGDGSISSSVHINKDGDNHINYHINITTTKEMAEWLKDYFKIGSVFKDKRRDNTWYYTINGNLNVIKFYNICYGHSTIWLDRKKERFEELLTKYTER